MSDYDKILQLVKSDDTNNRLLGFQLAKSQGYDLDNLLKEVTKTNGIDHDGYNIGDYFLIWTFTTNLTWVFKIGLKDSVKYKVDLGHNNWCDGELFKCTEKQYEKLFINLITE